MTATIIDGRQIAHNLTNQITADINKRLQQGFPAPGLAVILVGEDPASKIYVNKKQEACSKAGIKSQCIKLPASISQAELQTAIHDCNQDPNIHGILLQLPLPTHLSAEPLVEGIDPHKDVDGFHPYNMGYLALRQPKLRPCTPYGVMKLLESTGQNIEGMHAVIIGASNIVGRPMALELLLAKCSVTVLHRFSKNIQSIIEIADILISATGKPGLIKSEWIKPSAIVIDVGINRQKNGKIVGDIEFESAKERAGWITPVPGGVGPMTVACLLNNTLQAAKYTQNG